jgi:YhcH/YjgK/YiaL family protein
VHRVYFDIQIPLSGEETYGLAEFDPAAAGSFDESKDIGFYDQKVVPVTLKPGEFAVFYPQTCAHAPACAIDAPRRIRKIIVKVKA